MAANKAFPIMKAYGQATLSSGTVVVADETQVAASDRIFLTYAGDGALSNSGVLSEGTRVAGTGFTILSSNASDANKVNYLIVTG